MRQFETGLAVGKFYPPHAGHHKLIDTMVEECETALVAVCHSSVENIDVGKRIGWLEDRHPTVKFFPVKDDTPVLYTDQTWEWFLEALMDGLDKVTTDETGTVTEVAFPEVVYSGESYVPDFARRLTERYDRRVFRNEFPEKVRYRLLDRNDLPGVSATAFRNDPVGNWEVLAPATRAGMALHVVVLGAESSGTTTLAKELAGLYKTTVVPEYGRHFDWAVGKHHAWKHQDFWHIAEKQIEWEDYLARESHNGVLICDTDAHATAMFHEVYLGEPDPNLLNLARIESDGKRKVYIVTDHTDVPFEDDGTRYNSGKRQWMTDWFMEQFGTGVTQSPHILVSGSPAQRLHQADLFIAKCIQGHFQIETPIEYREENLELLKEAGRI